MQTQYISNPQSNNKSIKHGKSNTPVYWAWAAMRARCNNPNHQYYHKYGGRGIYVCARWDRSFDAFLEDMGEPPDGMSLDRIDVNGPYSPDNCRWATPAEQTMNRRCSILVTVDGDTKSIAEWSAIYGVPRLAIHQRIKRGVCPEVAVKFPAKRGQKIPRKG